MGTVTHTGPAVLSWPDPAAGGGAADDDLVGVESRCRDGLDWFCDICT
ncbi:MAG TPA: hypothetical protein VKU91_01415 [Acidimicrobiales bacterium]|nr:hypothetical protein [Acidimicrobiales bacterium]